MNPDLHTITIARDIAEEEAATAYEALSEEVQELREEERNCPFYGCHDAMGLLIDSGGNQCALISESYSPCKMELEGLPVNWKTCPVFLDRRR